MNTFLEGIRRVLNCAKVQVAASGLASTWLAVRYAALSLPPTQRSALWVAFIGAATVELREIINAWTEEDVARVNAEASRAVELPATVSPTPAIPPVPRPSVPAASPREVQPTTLLESSTMPLRTKLPTAFLVCCLLPLATAGSGCQTSPELAVYREGLHQVDEPLYQAHLLLLDDAIKAKLRTETDRTVVQQGINAANDLYDQSRKADAAGQ